MATNTPPAPTRIDGLLIKRLRPDIDAALKEVGERYGIVFEAGNASFDREGKTGQIKIDMVVKDASGNAVDIDAENFKRYAHLYGLDADDLGKEIRIQSRIFAVCGLNPKARRNPILIKDADGKVFTTQEYTVKRQLHPDKA